MADNDRTRYRDNEAYRRPRSQPAPAAGDPLAELARLIGQQNESAPSSQENGARSPYGARSDADQGWAMPDPQPRADRYRPNEEASHWSGSYPDDPAAGSGGYGNRRYDSQESHYATRAPQADRGYGAAHYPSSYGAPHSADQHYPDPQYADPRYGDPGYAADHGYGDPRYADARYSDPHYDAAAQDYSDPRYADPRYADPRYSDPNFGSRHALVPQSYAQSGSSQGYAGYGYQDGGQSYADGYFGGAVAPTPVAERQAPARRPGNIVTVLAVLALAVVGTAAAFGYRAMFGGTGTPVPPPVIKADTRPSKVVPTTDPNAKPIQDRVGVKTERVVPREEEPVQQAAPGQPRMIAPWLAGNPQVVTATARPNAAQPAAGNAAAPPTQPAAAEPKRIRTVPIKPEQGAEAPAARGSRSAAAVPAQPDSDPDSAQAGGAPLALSPTGSLPAPQRQAARQATAAIPPAQSGAGNGSPFPAPIASANPAAIANPASAAYAVQVTSQRSEADAQSSFRSLQQQFPSVLGNRQPTIRRADLGEKGTYYRAQIPFASQSEANDFCSNLKAAGGQCVVQRN